MQETFLESILTTFFQNADSFQTLDARITLEATIWVPRQAGKTKHRLDITRHMLLSICILLRLDYSSRRTQLIRVCHPSLMDARTRRFGAFSPTPPL